MGRTGIVACVATAAALAGIGCGGSTETGIQIIVHGQGIAGASEIVLYLGQAEHPDGVTPGDAGVVGRPDATSVDALVHKDGGDGNDHDAKLAIDASIGGSGGGSGSNVNTGSGSDIMTGSGSDIMTGSGSAFFVPFLAAASDGFPETISLTTQHSGAARTVDLFKRAHANTGDRLPYSADKSDYTFLFQPNSGGDAGAGDGNTFDVLAAIAVDSNGVPLALAIHGGVTMVAGQVNTYELDLAPTTNLATAASANGAGSDGVELWPDGMGANACLRIAQAGQDDIAIVNSKSDPDCDGATPECVPNVYDGSTAAPTTPPSRYSCSGMRSATSTGNTAASVCELGDSTCTDGVPRGMCGGSRYCLPATLCGPGCTDDPTSSECLAAVPKGARISCTFFGKYDLTADQGGDPVLVCPQAAALPKISVGSGQGPSARAFVNPLFLSGPGAPTSQVTIQDLGSVGIVTVAVPPTEDSPVITVSGHIQSYTTTTLLMLAQLSTSQSGRGVAVPIDLYFTKTDECSSNTSMPICALAGSGSTDDGSDVAELTTCISTVPPQ